MRSLLANPLYVLILPLCTTLIALGFVLAWRWQPQQRDLLWMSGCFALFSTGVCMQLLVVPAALDTNAVLSAALYHASVGCLAQAMALRLRVSMWRMGAMLVALSAWCLLSYYAYVDDQLYARIYILNFGLAAQLAVSTWRIWRVRAATRLERLLRTVFACFVLSFVVRTVLTMPEQAGLHADNFSQTVSWMAVQMCLLLFALLFAMLYIALVIQQAMGKLYEERDRDPLTQLLNRRAFDEAVGRLPPLVPAGTVMVCDIDHFKQVNDQWGHAVGDVVLQSMAQVLRDCVRGADLVMRYGGEEFVLLLPGMPVAAAVLLAQRIGAQLARLSHPALPPGLRITASFGIAEVTHLALLQAAMVEADAQLYAAKAAGRNCVRWQPPASATPAEARSTALH